MRMKLFRRNCGKKSPVQSAVATEWRPFSSAWIHGLIRRRPRSNRYEVTPEGLRIALFLTRAYARFFRVAFADPPLAQPDAGLSSRVRSFRKAAQPIDQLIEEARIAA